MQIASPKEERRKDGAAITREYLQFYTEKEETDKRWMAETDNGRKNQRKKYRNQEGKQEKNGRTEDRNQRK